MIEVSSCGSARRKCKTLQAAKVKAEICTSTYAGLKRAWDGERLRAGDLAIPMDADEDRNVKSRHCNENLPGGVMRTAWQGLGKGLVARAGVDGTHDLLSMQCGLSSACSKAQARELTRLFARMSDQPDAFGGIVIGRHYDTTPFHVQFNRLHEQLHPHARYMVKAKTDNGQERWKLVPLQLYREMNPRVRLSFGVVEVMMQRATVHFMANAGDQHPEYKQHELICQPTVLQRSSVNIRFVQVADRAMFDWTYNVWNATAVNYF
jgi:hypothetical protein